MGNAVRLPLALLLLGALAACSSNRAKAPDAAETMTPPAASAAMTEVRRFCEVAM